MINNNQEPKLKNIQISPAWKQECTPNMHKDVILLLERVIHYFGQIDAYPLRKGYYVTYTRKQFFKHRIYTYNQDDLNSFNKMNFTKEIAIEPKNDT